MKTCTRCGKSKPLDKFRRRSRSGDGRETRCRVCRVEVTHGLPRGGLRRMFDDQQGVCGCCREPLGEWGVDAKFDVDHDHRWSKGELEGVRGLVHVNCNRRLVAAVESGLVERAERYLARHRHPSSRGRWNGGR